MNRRGGVRRFSHLLALSSFAIAQPLLAKLGPVPGYFAAHGLTSLEVGALAAALVLVPWLVLVVIEAVLGLLGRRVRWVVHLLLVAALVGLIALPLLGSLSARLAYALAGLVGIGFAAAYARFRGVRTFTSALAFAPALFLAVFLFVGPTSKMVLGGQLDAWRAGESFRPPVVFLQFDALPSLLLETPSRGIDAIRFPNFAQLARDGVWYRNASNVHENTVFSVPSIVDAQLPVKGTTPVVQDHPQNLFTVLGPGYRMNVTEEATTLCPYEYCRGPGPSDGNLWDDTRVVFNQAIRPESERANLPSISHSWTDFHAGPRKQGFRTLTKSPEYVIRHLNAGRIGRFNRWFGRLGRGGERPELDYIHMFMPHEPREYMPDGRRYVTPDLALEDASSYNNAYLSAMEEQRTILQLEYTDRLLGQVIMRLKQIGIYDDAFIVAVADYGESFLPAAARPQGPFVPGHLGYRRAVTSRNLADIASIPMIVKYPKDHGPSGIDSRYVRDLDIFPTIAHELGLRLAPVAGSLLGRPGYRGQRQVRVGTTFDGTVRASVTRWQRRRDRSLSRRLRLFGSGRHSLYEFGPHREMVGHPITDFELVPQPVTPHATVDGAKRFGSVDPTAPVCLCQVGGRIEAAGTGGLPAATTVAPAGGAQPPPSAPNVAGMPLAIALNGRIVTTAEGFAAHGAKKLNWAAMIPPGAYRDGRNELAIYWIQGARKLAQIGGAP